MMNLTPLDILQSLLGPQNSPFIARTTGFGNPSATRLLAVPTTRQAIPSGRMIASDTIQQSDFQSLIAHVRQGVLFGLHTVGKPGTSPSSFDAPRPIVLQNGPDQATPGEDLFMALSLDEITPGETLADALRYAFLMYQIDNANAPTHRFLPDPIHQIREYINRISEDEDPIQAVAQVLASWIASQQAIPEEQIEPVSSAPPADHPGLSLGHQKANHFPPGLFLRALEIRLLNRLQRIQGLSADMESAQFLTADEAELPAALSAGRLHPSQILPPTLRNDDSSLLRSGLVQSDSTRGTQTVLASVDPAIPDLIYCTFPESLRRDPTNFNSAKMRVLDLSQRTLSDPIRMLEDLIGRIRAIDPENPLLNPASGQDGIGAFLLNRLVEAGRQALQLHASNTNFHAPVPALESRIESVMQVREALNDMMERMRGNLTIDPQNLRAVIHLDPPALGRLQINLAIDDNHHLITQITSEQSATQDFLRQNQEDLRQGLMQWGFQAEDIDLQFSPAGEPSFDFHIQRAGIA